VKTMIIITTNIIIIIMETAGINNENIIGGEDSCNKDSNENKINIELQGDLILSKGDCSIATTQASASSDETPRSMEPTCQNVNDVLEDVKPVGTPLKINLAFSGTVFPLVALTSDTVLQFKEQIQTATGVPVAMQKLMYRGAMKDDMTLSEYRVQSNAKILLIGCTLSDVLKINALPSSSTAQPLAEATSNSSEPLSKQKMHIKMIERGVPDDAMPGIINVHESLPSTPVHGMVNKYGNKIRLTFKLEIDELWIGSKENTNKVPMSQIRDIVSEPIVGHEQYHIMGIQLGPTEQSRYWLYWVPAQYVKAIKQTILGH